LKLYNNFLFPKQDSLNNSSGKKANNYKNGIQSKYNNVQSKIFSQPKKKISNDITGTSAKSKYVCS
jgi:hypothetical protein